MAWDRGTEAISEVGTAPGGHRRVRPHRLEWLSYKFGAIVVVTALLVSLVGTGMAFGLSVTGEPRTIHVFGRDYIRFEPCCEWGQWWHNGPIPMSRVRAAFQAAGGYSYEPAVVRLEGPPAGWFGVADPVTSPATPEVLLQEGPDSYYLYVSNP
jgi:hypothetical protein